MRRAFLALVGAAIAVALAYLIFGGRGADTLVVGGKKFTEGYLLGEMTAAVLRDAGFRVTERFDMGSAPVRSALEHGQVDVYWEYTGTAYVMHHKKDDAAVMRDRERLYDTVKRLDAGRGLVWLETADFNNTYTLMMTGARADKLGIRTIGDLAAHVREHPDSVTLASNAEWFARPDGFQGLAEHYGFRFPPDRVKKMDAGLIYRALRDGAVDVGMGYSTDARIVALDLVTLADDRNFFPVYNPAPVVRAGVLERHPELRGLLNGIAERLDGETITRLNYRVDIEKESPAAVAADWLKRQGLL